MELLELGGAVCVGEGSVWKPRKYCKEKSYDGVEVVRVIH